MKSRTIMIFLISLFLTSVLVSCGGLKSKNTIYKTNKQYPPYTGEVRVFWKEYEMPQTAYSTIATISAEPFWAGIHTNAAAYKPLHDYIINKAAEVGGNGVIIHCGALGTVGQTICSGDAIWLK